MAIFHMSAQMLTRSKGHTATKAAAYRHAAKITDEKTGEVHDFTRKKGVYASMTLTPENTPDHLKESPEALWNAVEKSENRSNSQVAREFNIALPHELSDDQKVALAKEFCQEHLVKHGMIADVAFHDFDSENPHFHVMATTRKVDPNSPTGFSKNKPREWNDKAFLEGLREDWANTANSHLKKAGSDARIDHRSLADQRAELDAIENPTVEQQAQAIALDRDPTIHRGRSGNPERQERFDKLQGEKVAQEATAKTFFENSQIKMPTPKPAASSATPAPDSADDGGGYASINVNTAKRALKGMATSFILQTVPGAGFIKNEYDDLFNPSSYENQRVEYTPDEKKEKPQQGAGGNAKQQKQGNNKPATTQQQPTITGDDFHDIKGMSKSQIEELEALDEVHAAQRKAAAETEKATAGFSSANIQQNAPQLSPEPSAPAARGGSFKDRLKMTKAHLAEKSQAEEEAQDHERKRRRGLGLLH